MRDKKLCPDSLRGSGPGRGSRSAAPARRGHGETSAGRCWRQNCSRWTVAATSTAANSMSTLRRQPPVQAAAGQAARVTTAARRRSVSSPPTAAVPNRASVSALQWRRSSANSRPSWRTAAVHSPLHHPAAHRSVAMVGGVLGLYQLQQGGCRGCPVDQAGRHPGEQHRRPQPAPRTGSPQGDCAGTGRICRCRPTRRHTTAGQYRRRAEGGAVGSGGSGGVVEGVQDGR